MNRKYVVTKNGQYLCCSSADHQMYFGDDREKAMIIQNKRLAADIAYDYRARQREFEKKPEWQAPVFACKSHFLKNYHTFYIKIKRKMEVK